MNPIDIYIDNIVMNFQKIGGISVYLTMIISRLLRDKFKFKMIEQSRVKFNVLRKGLDVPDGAILKEKFLPLRLLSYMPIRIRLKNRALVHSSYYRICNHPWAANVITVYDFNYELGYVRSGMRKYLHCRQKRRAIEKADGILSISESTKHDLLKFYPKVSPAKIRVVYLAAGSEFFHIDTELPVPEALRHVLGFKGRKYVLFVGARIFHKNFDICVDTLAKMPGYQLFIVGGSLTPDEARCLEEKLPSRYQAFHNICAADLNYLYNFAYCFIYPTSYEGFGIPVLEAMQAGCPVVSTKCSSIPEVCGDAGLLVDEISPDEFVKKIRSLEDLSFRGRVIDAGFAQAKKFSWDKTFEETIAYYSEVFNAKFPGGEK
jgi:glycosyltransferase involved in cell wall biosynthesis